MYMYAHFEVGCSTEHSLAQRAPHVKKKYLIILACENGTSTCVLHMYIVCAYSVHAHTMYMTLYTVVADENAE